MKKYFYFAVQVEENGKYYAFVVKVSPSDNILSRLRIKNIITANICPSRKQAAAMGEALKKYQEAVKEQYYIDISDNAIKNKCPMYRDTKTGEAVQVGFVLTASTDFDNDRRGWVKQYIDLWVTVQTVANPFQEVTA